MNIADSFYIALCMTVLLLGVVYWFWTQTQYLQRKINLLENIVYELKTSMDPHGEGLPGAIGPSPPGGHPPSGIPSPAGVPSSRIEPEAKYPPAPGSELGEDEDLLHETLLQESGAPVISKEEAVPSVVAESVVPDDLQPGGVGSGLPESSREEAQRPRGHVLDGMTLKELRRLAEQRNVPGASNMRKQALIDALRSEVVRDATAASLTGSASADAVPVADLKVGTVTPFEDTTEDKAIELV
jgi:hypothetical protein